MHVRDCRNQRYVSKQRDVSKQPDCQSLTALDSD